MTEPLGESQVVQYLLDLAKDNSIHLLSFEKSIDQNKYAAMQKKIGDAGIQWKFFSYSNRYGIFSSVWQILIAFLFLKKWTKKKNIEIIHARSLIPAVMGVLIKKLSNIKLLFDIRGFAIDEKIMEGRIRENSLLSNILKKIESYVYQNADHIVTLTHASKPIIEKNYKINLKNITVIPTCANIEIFKPLSKSEKNNLKKSMGFTEEDVIFLRNGSLNESYDFKAEFKLFEQIAKLNPQAKFIFLNKGQHNLILSNLAKCQISNDRYQIISSDFTKVNDYLNAADMCVFFIKPSFAKQASAPTKFAEMVAAHLYAATNTQYGDMEQYFGSYRVGILLELAFVHSDPKKAAQQVLEFIETSRDNDCEDDGEDFNQLFAEHFSKKIAVEKYQHIYMDLNKA